MQNIKLVVTGDGTVGKTCMLVAYITGAFPADYHPTVFDTRSVRTDIDGIATNLELWDTAGHEGYDRLRPFSYPETDIFFICYSCCSRASFDNVRSKWIPEIQHHAPSIPIILVSTKSDLRKCEETRRKLKAKGEDYVEIDEAREIMNEYEDVVAVLENSAWTQEGLKESFELAIRHSLSETYLVRNGLRPVMKYPFAVWVPFKVGDWIYAYNKGKRNIAIVRKIDK